jgi:hypothetical protein
MRRLHRAYPTDLTDAQRAAISELVPDAAPGFAAASHGNWSTDSSLLWTFRPTTFVC